MSSYQTTLKVLSKQTFERFRKLVYSKSGIHLSEEKLCLLSNRLRKRLRALSLDSFEDYYGLLTTKSAASDEEMGHFLSAITTNETYFLRNARLWEWFRTEMPVALAETFPMRGKPHYQFWSAAASSGEEAYTMAMMLRKHLSGYDPALCKIIGTDLSDRVLGMAKAGIYTDYSVQKIDEADRKAFFEHDAEKKEWRIKNELRRGVEFLQHNLRDAFTRTRFHVTFLRNVMMYFDTPMKRTVIERIKAATHPGGFIVIGDVDPLRQGDGLREHAGLEQIRPTIYRRP